MITVFIFITDVLQCRYNTIRHKKEATRRLLTDGVMPESRRRAIYLAADGADSPSRPSQRACVPTR